MSLAGRPPFATDEPDTLYETQPAPRRVRQQPPPDPNHRTSAYNMYDDYLDGATPATHPQQPQPSIPLAAPRPGYPAPIAALNLARPNPSAVPVGRQQQGPPAPLYVPGGNISPVPSTPHPLTAPMTPIAPAFARPPKTPAAKEGVTFAEGPKILRGGSEDQLIPKRGEKGDDFWRRFSMVAKEDNKLPPALKQSTWLSKTTGGYSKFSRWVWVIGMILLVCIISSIALTVYKTHNKVASMPGTLGGSANETLISTAISSSSSTHAGGSSSSPHVSPTNTVQRRDAPAAEPTALWIVPRAESDAGLEMHFKKRHSKRGSNRMKSS